jgi:hypothetical protein
MKNRNWKYGNGEWEDIIIYIPTAFAATSLLALIEFVLLAHWVGLM